MTQTRKLVQTLAVDNFNSPKDPQKTLLFILASSRFDKIKLKEENCNIDTVVAAKI